MKCSNCGDDLWCAMCGEKHDPDGVLLTRAEWEASMTEEHRIGIEVDVGNGPERPKWKRLVTEWEPDGVVDVAIGDKT